MATDTMASPLSMVSPMLPDVDPSTTHSVIRPDETMDAGDDRSSSLSEIGERGGRDEPENEIDGPSDAIDTEAETERLEDSPQKIRKHQNVVLTQINRVNDAPHGSIATHTITPLPVSTGPQTTVDQGEPGSEISSLADSSDDVEKVLLASPTSLRKRKRSSLEDDSISDQDSVSGPSIKANEISRSASASALVEDPYLDDFGEDVGQVTAAKTTASAMSDTRLGNSPETVLLKENYRNRKRKGRKTSVENLDNESTGAPKLQNTSRRDENQDAVSSNEDEDENDEAGDVPGAENAAKTEEGVVQKKTALDSLNAMEKCFAKLRDKLFDDRLAQCNDELAMLESAVPTHPELLAMKDVIDQRRDGKIQYERTLLMYNLQTLQRESIANKAQSHSQYMQSARDIRDRHLEKLNKMFYQFQRERRNVDGDVPEYMSAYNPKRSQQITQQTAYNTEVSILSGVAKFVGFPAAPEIPKAKPKEIEDDLRTMGISSQAPRALYHPPPIPRAASSFSRQRSGADEQFLEQNPWANPQHPSHHQPRQQLHRQISAISRTATPTLTPAAQKRVVDLTEPQGSASTIPDNPSGPNSSLAATPATAEAAKALPSSQSHQGNNVIDLTPSKASSGPFEGSPSNLALLESATERSKISQNARSEQSHSPSLMTNPSQDNQNPNHLPKPLPFLHTGASSSAPAPRTSTPGRYTVVKAEDPTRGARHSSMPRYHTPPVTTVANGLMNRFAA